MVPTSRIETPILDSTSRMKQYPRRKLIKPLSSIRGGIVRREVMEVIRRIIGNHKSFE
jgi:hypothetical protein